MAETIGLARPGSDGGLSRFSDTASPETVDLALDVKLWHVPGVHELLASLGLDLMGVGETEVTLRPGKSASLRPVSFALQALLALFDTQEAPKSLSLESASSLESLASLGAEEEADHLAPMLPITPAPPPPLLRHTGGAFTSYVRRRGEPDGRTSVETSPQYQLHNSVSKSRNFATTTGSVQREVGSRVVGLDGQENRCQTSWLRLAERTGVCY
ncbi:uncharacterized protein LOC103517661 [Diaphorina citri]|uniref:Uncharacterized protein LOC103517661 n=1 Tax=Diaphorina citri TaxID=121845 RepID=A0A1S3DFP6_DIACI|nr:uncharacterized protein LOC103517661 [Diaphorina citri]